MSPGGETEARKWSRYYDLFTHRSEKYDRRCQEEDDILPLARLVWAICQQHQFADTVDYLTMRESAKDTLNRQLRSGINDEQLTQLVVDLRADDRLCIVQDETEQQEPQIICSLGLFEGEAGER